MDFWHRFLGLAEPRRAVGNRPNGARGGPDYVEAAGKRKAMTPPPMRWRRSSSSPKTSRQIARIRRMT